MDRFQIEKMVDLDQRDYKKKSFNQPVVIARTNICLYLALPYPFLKWANTEDYEYMSDNACSFCMIYNCL